MTPAIALLILRVASSILLISFIILIAWFIHRDLIVTSKAMLMAERPYGTLRVVVNDNDEPAVGTTFPLLAVTSIGRAPGNTIVLTDSYASAEHTLISRRDGQWWLQDQGSRNGTLLNETPVAGTAVISAGDLIAIGGTQLKVEF